MTKKDLAEVAIKVLGLYLLIMALDSIVGLIVSTTYFLNPNSPDSNKDLVYLLANSFRILFSAFGFWLLTFKTNNIVNKILKNNSENTITFNIDKKDFMQILFCASGIIVVYFATNEFWNALTKTVLWNTDNLPESKVQLLYFIQLGIPLSKLIIGLILIFQSGKLVRLIKK